ncbi:alpha/beta-Hydrolases superfamily protein [Striga asiatica]|uniref:soluble epoxide hydrolase n=1 Tax=Striga asiatica TaxID=4170 RepID=A0A5A7QDZ0_STRAF|nr:alpha/beta-Hydrolases superfamily protein [Striga asiatica]
MGLIFWASPCLACSGPSPSPSPDPSGLPNVVHNYIPLNGTNITMHVAEMGCSGSAGTILFLHGFPELWYSWRHQMTFFSAKGYRTIAPDLRGYGETSGAPTTINNSTVLHVLGDIVGLLEALGLERVYLVAHDWGANLAWLLCMMRPDKIIALVNSSIFFNPRNPKYPPTVTYAKALTDGFYIMRFQKAGDAEEAFALVGTETVIRTFMTINQTEPLVIPTNKSIATFFQGPQVPLPSWLTQDDLDYFTSKFNKTGFTGGLNYYRALDLSWELTAAWTGAQITVPAKFLIGEFDMTYKFPGVKETIASKSYKKLIPNLEEVVVMKGVGHFPNQVKADEFNKEVYNFIISKH